MKAEASVEIARSVEEVFAFLSDVSAMPSWVTGVRSARLISSEAGLGAHYLVHYSGGWRTLELEGVITVYERPHRFGTEMARGPFSFAGTFQLDPFEDGTKVTSIVATGEESLSIRVAMLLFGGLIRRSMRRRLLHELHDLRAGIEGSSPKADV